METRKLYYEDCHQNVFSAQVLSCEQVDGGWEVILDQTAFYPEGGGQACDLGVLGEAKVLDVQERGEAVVHLCDAPMECGTQVQGILDYARRFDLMQQHSGEHIVSGIICGRYGYHNVGFHVSSDVITIDFDGPIPAADLPEIEAMANEAVFQNLSIRAWYPTEAELPHVSYRTKKALPWPVRLVQIPGYDQCACCGVHVAFTGEIGPIKLYSVVKFHEGVRMEMACGKRVLNLLNRVYEQNVQVSQALSVPITETGKAVEDLKTLLAEERYKYAQLQNRMLAGIAQNYANAGDVLHFEDDLEPVQVRELADQIAAVCGGTAAVFSGVDGDRYKYALITRTGDLRAFGKAMTAALNGRGGGKPICQQGSVGATKAQIQAFFETH